MNNNKIPTSDHPWFQTEDEKKILEEYVQLNKLKDQNETGIETATLIDDILDEQPNPNAVS